jgi:hypothetical protein
MNEQIRELWRESVLKHTNDPMNWQTVADEFAELIVTECIDAALEAQADYYVINNMKSRLGVEE